MSPEELEIEDKYGCTAFSYTAMEGSIKMAKCTIAKNNKLVNLPNGLRRIPVVVSCMGNHKDMTHYLYSVTPFNLLGEDNGNYGSLLLQFSIICQMFDIALDLLHHFPILATALDKIWKCNAVFQLANMPDGFPSGSRLAFWQRWIYFCIHIGPLVACHGDRMHGPQQRKSDSRRIMLQDKSENTMLHWAGTLSPSTQLACISGAALQMQRELQWYQEVESIVNPMAKKYRNKNGETPSQLFTKDHQQLMAQGEQWMKETATSSTVVGALIITVMFTAAFTVPGGNGDAGFPIFLHKKSFATFITSDAISLFASTTSVLMFLGILTSRYSEKDFLKSLPTKLIIGLSTLFFSIATMMVAFCAALIIVLDGRLEVVIPISLLAGVPVTLFILLQFPLLVDIFKSTYGPGIFQRKMKRCY